MNGIFKPAEDFWHGGFFVLQDGAADEDGKRTPRRTETSHSVVTSLLVSAALATIAFSSIPALETATTTANVPPLPSASLSAVSGSIEEGERFSSVRTVLEEFSKLKKGWDGYGGQAPPKSAIADASNFLDLLPLGLPLPKASVGGDGEVVLFWEQNGVYADVGFVGDRTTTYYAESPSGLEIAASQVLFQGAAKNFADLFEVIRNAKTS